MVLEARRGVIQLLAFLLRIMRDKVSIPRVQELHPLIRQEAADIIDFLETFLSDKVAVRVVEGLRSIEGQNKLYEKGRNLPGPIVTNARGGRSYHNYGLAIDYAILIDKEGDGNFDELSWDIRKDNDRDGIADWLEVARAFEHAGWEWGGKWSSLKDYPHVQKTFGYSWKQLLRKYENKDFIPGTTYVNI